MTSTQCAECFEGGLEPIVFQRSFYVFDWIDLSCGRPPNIPAYPECVSVLLHL
jgi:hypothetical protein